jgi:hypothetical protein
MQTRKQLVGSRTVESALDPEHRLAFEHRQDRRESLAGAKRGGAKHERRRDSLAAEMLGDASGGRHPRGASGRSRSSSAESSQLDFACLSR